LNRSGFKYGSIKNIIMEWSKLECETIVTDYLSMLEKELKGESFNKTEHRKLLQEKCSGRSEGSIEYKHQNISAILIELGYPYIIGYKPAFNYQKLLKETIEAALQINSIAQASDELIAEETMDVKGVKWDKVLVDAPDFNYQESKILTRDFNPRQYNFTDRERQNKKLGIDGEEFTLNYERQRLARAGRDDLVREIEWTSKDKGDGAGYDIRSFNLDDEKELFIEVKTTKLGKYLPFYVSNNEVEFSKLNQKQYSLYRIYEYRNDPKLFMLNGDISQKVNLQTTMYKASF
jgi:uncharacterized protein DUF3883